MTHYDIAVIGAGIAGLVCARELQQAGYLVVILEKSRGLGGRVATRRLHDTCADHGTCYLSANGDRFQAFLQQLLEANVLHGWTERVHTVDAAGTLHEGDRKSRYAAADGMTAIAKFLASGLDIRLGHQVRSLALQNGHWKITAATPPDDPVEITATTLILTAPAPQAAALLQPLAALSPEFLHQVQSVEFLPNLTIMSGYGDDRLHQWTDRYPDVKAITFSDHPVLGYLGLDSSKRSQPAPLVFVVQSSAAFAAQYLDAEDLQPAATILLEAAATGFADWLAQPDWTQIHRWRYAFAKTPRSQPYLATTTPAPLICTGDWCGGRKVEDAFLAGLATADYYRSQRDRL